MRKALFAPCYPGELGWELINYAPYVNYHCKKNSYDEVHIVVRKGREAVYPMGTHLYPIKLSTNKSMGNSGSSPPASKIPKELSKQGFEVTKVKELPPGCRFSKRRDFFKYEAQEGWLRKWRHIPNNAVTLTMRDRQFGRHKNWPLDSWKKLCDYLLSENFTPVLTGIRESKSPLSLPDGCLDLLGRTSLSDLIAIMQKSQFVVGQSTGPAHLASLSCVPHAIWGSARIEERYKKSWNPHKTLNEYYSCGKEFQCSTKEVIATISRLREKLNK